MCNQTKNNELLESYLERIAKYKKLADSTEQQRMEIERKHLEVLKRNIELEDHVRQHAKYSDKLEEQAEDGKVKLFMKEKALNEIKT